MSWQEQTEGFTDSSLASGFIDHDRLRKFLRGSSTYTPKMPELRRAFQANGVFVAPENRFGLGEFLPGMFLGPPTLKRILDVIPRIRPPVVTGLALRPPAEGMPTSLTRFFDVTASRDGDPLPSDEMLSFGRVTKNPGALTRVSGEVTYESTILSNNPFEPEKATVRFTARQGNGYVDVYTVSTEDRGFFMLSKALSIAGREHGTWETVRVDEGQFPDTFSRHAALRRVVQELTANDFVFLGVYRYEARKAENPGTVVVSPFDSAHRNRQAELTKHDLNDVMDEMERVGAYVSMADMLFHYRDEDQATTIARIEVFLKLQHQRLDISFKDARALGDKALSDIYSLDAYQRLESRNKSVEEAESLLKGIWVSISPSVMEPLVARALGVATPMLPL